MACMKVLLTACLYHLFRLDPALSGKHACTLPGDPTHLCTSSPLTATSHIVANSRPGVYTNCVPRRVKKLAYTESSHVSEEHSCITCTILLSCCDTALRMYKTYSEARNPTYVALVEHCINVLETVYSIFPRSVKGIFCYSCLY